MLNAVLMMAQSTFEYNPIFESHDYIKAKEIKSIAFGVVKNTDSRRKQLWYFDHNGYPEKKVDSSENGLKISLLKNEIDKKGRLKRATERDVKSQKIGEERYRYDENGNLVEKINDTGMPYVGQIQTKYIYEDNQLRTELEYLPEGNQLIFLSRYFYNDEGGLDSSNRYAMNEGKEVLIQHVAKRYHKGQLKDELMVNQNSDTLEYKKYNVNNQLIYAVEMLSALHAKSGIFGIDTRRMGVPSDEIELIRRYFEYNERGLLSREYFSNGELKYTYDANGRVIRKETKEGYGQESEYWEADGWSFKADFLLNPAKSNQAVKDTLEVIRTKYSKMGKTEIIGGKQLSSFFSGKMLIIKKYNSDDKLLSSTRMNYETDQDCETNYTYSPTVHVETQKCLVGSRKFESSSIITSYFDDRGNRIKEEMENIYGDRKAFEKMYSLNLEYDENDNIIRKINYFFRKPGDTTASQWNYFYNDKGQLIKAGLLGNGGKAEFRNTEEYSYENGVLAKTIKNNHLSYSGNVVKTEEIFHNSNGEIEKVLFFNEQGAIQNSAAMKFNEHGDVVGVVYSDNNGREREVYFRYEYYNKK